MPNCASDVTQVTTFSFLASSVCVYIYIYKFNRFLRKFHFRVKFLSSCNNDFLTSFHFRLHRTFSKKKKEGKKAGTSFTKNLTSIEGLSRMTSKNEKPSLFFFFLFSFLPSPFFRRRPIYVFVSPVSARMTRTKSAPASQLTRVAWVILPDLGRGMHAPLFGCVDRLFRYYANKVLNNEHLDWILEKDARKGEEEGVRNHRAQKETIRTKIECKYISLDIGSIGS